MIYGNQFVPNLIKTRILAAVMALPLVLTGCESMPINTDLLLKSGTAILGGLGCREIAKQFGVSTRQANVWAAACAAGSIAAMNRLEKRRDSYQSQEAFYSGETEKLQQYNAELERDIDAAQVSIREQKQKMEDLRSSTSSAATKKQQAQSVAAKMSKQQALLKAKLKEAKIRQDDQKALVAMIEKDGKSAASAQRQLEELEADIALLNNALDDTESLTASVGSSI